MPAKPRAPDYMKRSAIECFFSVLKMKLGLLYVRFNAFSL